MSEFVRNAPLQISQTVEYALRAVVWLAQHPAAPRTTQQIAEATGVSASYLAKVLQSLARAGIVTGQRGLHGGFTLARPADELTVLDVADAAEPGWRSRDNAPADAESDAALAALSRAIRQAMDKVDHTFAQQTIHDLLDPSTESAPDA